MTITAPRDDDSAPSLRDLIDLTPNQTEAATLLVGGAIHLEVANQLSIPLKLLHAWEKHHYGFQAHYLLLAELAERQAHNQYRELVAQHTATEAYRLDLDPDYQPRPLPPPPPPPPHRHVPTAFDLLEADVQAELDTDVRRNNYAALDEITPGAPHRPYRTVLAAVVTHHNHALELAQETNP